MTTWTEERVAALRKCIDDGLSSGKTAIRFYLLFKIEISRQAIIGKARRLGFTWHNAPLNRGGAIVNKINGRQERARKPPVSPPPPDVRAREMPAEPPRAIRPAPSSRPVDLMGLTNATCRWPLWTDDEPRLFCGALEADNADGRPYCPEHAAASVGRTYTRPDRIAAAPLGRRNVLPSRIALDKASE